LNAQLAQLLASAPVGIVAGIEYRDATLQLKFKAPPDAQLQNQLARAGRAAGPAAALQRGRGGARQRRGG